MKSDSLITIGLVSLSVVSALVSFLLAKLDARDKKRKYLGLRPDDLKNYTAYISLLSTIFLISLQTKKDIDSNTTLLNRYKHVDSVDGKHFDSTLNAIGNSLKLQKVSIDSTDTVLRRQKKSLDANNELLKGQENEFSELKRVIKEIHRTQNPIEIFSVDYRISIPGKQENVIEYKERILKLKEIDQRLLFNDRERLPNAKNPKEATLAQFMTFLFNTTSFTRVKKNDLYKSSLIINDSVFPTNSMNALLADLSIGNIRLPKVMFSYIKGSDEFVLTVKAENPTQTSRDDMLSLDDFSEKNVFCDIIPPSDSIDFKLIYLSLTTKNGRVLALKDFKTLKISQNSRTFYKKLAKDVVFR